MRTGGGHVGDGPSSRARARATPPAREHLHAKNTQASMSDSTAVKRQLVIKTGVVKRLTKEEQTYVKEVQEQRERIKRVEADKDADEWNVKQQHKVLQDCLQMVPDCRRRLEAAVEDLKLFSEGLDEDLAATPEAQAAKDALQAATAAVEQAAGSEA